MPSTTKDAHMGAKWVMLSACLVYEVLFQGQSEAVEQSRENTFERVQAVALNHSYTWRKMAVLSYPVFDLLRPQNSEPGFYCYYVFIDV